MARSRKIKRSRNSKKSFLPESLQAFVARRLVDCIALFFAGCAAFLFASLFTYSSSDPSWNTASENTGARIANVGGESGAYLSDLLLQTIGYGGFCIAAGLMIWGYRVFKRQTVRPLTLRLAALLVASVFASVALARVPAGTWLENEYLGSSTGALFLGSAVSSLSVFNLPYLDVTLCLVSAVLAIGVFLYAAAFSTYEIASMWFRLKIAAFTVFGFVMAMVGRFVGWVQHYNEPDYEAVPSAGLNLGVMEKLRDMKAQRALAKEEHVAALKAKADERAARKSIEDERKKAAAATIKTAPKIKDEEPPFEPTHSVAPSSSGISIPVVTPKEASPKPAAKAKDTAQKRFALSDVDGEWELPPVSLIQEVPAEAKGEVLNEDALRKNAELLQSVLEDFNIKGEIVSIHPGPVVTLYEFEPAPGTKSSRIISLSDDIARSMSAISVRCAVVPGRNVIGIELPNKKRQTVYMKEMLLSRMYDKTSAKLPLILGKDIGGQPILADLAKMPHLLVAGTTGSGKSVAVNTMIMSLLYRLSPEKCRFIMIDPKMLELSVYDDIPHLLTPVVTEPGKAVVALKWAVREMEDRYRNMSKLGVRNIEGYNQRMRDAIKNDEQIMHKVQTGFEPDTGKPIFEDHPMPLAELPYIVIIVDEFADLMLVAGKDVENAIQRLAQMARAAGLHLIMATQRPSVDVITGVVKANFPTRISFQVTSKIDSRTILGDGGAEQLLGMGDMLYMAPGGRITRVHGPFCSDDDVEKATDFLRAQAKPAYIDDVTSEDSDFGGSEVMNAMFGGSSGGGGDDVDELYDQAVAVITREGKVSTSFIQRHLQIGYNRAARIVEEMERQGVISPANSAGKRHILVSDHSGA